MAGGFELLELQRKGQLGTTGFSEDWIVRSRSKHQLLEAPLTTEIAMETRDGDAQFSLPHHDPVDKLLVATARIFQLTPVTADRNIIGLKAVAILAAR